MGPELFQLRVKSTPDLVLMAGVAVRAQRASVDKVKLHLVERKQLIGGPQCWSRSARF